MEDLEGKCSPRERFEAKGYSILLSFTLVADALSRLVQYCIERRLLKGFMVDKNEIHLSHLHYADDDKKRKHKELRQLVFGNQFWTDLEVNGIHGEV